MLRTPSVRTMSLADLDSLPEVRSAKKERRSTQADAASQPADKVVSRTAAPRSAAMADTTQPHVLKGVRAPADAAKPQRSLAQAEQALLSQYDADSLGHNGCVLDGDVPQSIDAYLNMARAILLSSHQVAPGHEIGRVMAAASSCRAMATSFGAQQVEFAAQDKAGKKSLAARTALHMAKQSMQAEGAKLSGLRHLGREIEETTRHWPEAYKAVHQQSREGQAERRAKTWMTFANDISNFCLEAVAAFYPEVIDAQQLRLDPQLHAVNPQQAHEEAVKRALTLKALNLKREVLTLHET